MQNTYWNSKGKYQEQADQLNRLIPHFGECEDKRGSNRQLERFRKAGNCYYDLFNNGLGNRAKEFYSVFKIGYKKFCSNGRYLSGDDFKRIGAKVEPLMDEIILSACKEQGISIITAPLKDYERF